jgi:hypothetical protein
MLNPARLLFALPHGCIGYFDPKLNQFGLEFFPCLSMRAERIQKYNRI